MNGNTFFKYVRSKFATASVLTVAGLVLTVAAQLALPVFARAAAPPPAAASSPATFGSVNIEQVLAEANARKKDTEDLNAMLTNLRTVNATLQQKSGVFLNEAQMRELAGLYEKESPTEVEKKRIAQLELSAETAKRDLATLESTPQPTDDQRRRYNELGAMKQQGEQNMQQLGQDFQERLRKHEEELTTKTIATIREAIASVAKSKGIAVVFDSKVAVYTTNEITADVIKQVNK